MSTLNHQTVFLDSPKVAVALPFVDDLRQYHPEGTFPLAEDPISSGRTAIIGMFVLRPATVPLVTESTLSVEETSAELFREDLDWVYNVHGADGGGLIANGAVCDAYRLAMQYHLSDAVLIGSNCVAVDGVAGYLWQGYSVCEWGHVKAADPNLFSKFAENRELWQRMGYLSARKYPATIVVTRTGELYPQGDYFLKGRIFDETQRHPTGEAFEVYIITSRGGALNVRANAAKFGITADRLERMLIVIPGEESEDPFSLDISRIPSVLYQEPYNMRIVDHDGGRDLLNDFLVAGALSQLNLTFGRGTTVRDAVQTCPTFFFRDTTREAVLADFSQRIRYFFRSKDPSGKISHGIPRHLKVLSLIKDSEQKCLIASLTSREKKPFYEKV